MDESGCPQGASSVKITSGSPDGKLRVATTPFIANNYWSSSVYNGNTGQRCKLNFNNGNFNNNNTSNNNYVRCVRDSFTNLRSIKDSMLERFESIRQRDHLVPVLDTIAVKLSYKALIMTGLVTGLFAVGFNRRISNGYIILDFSPINS